MSKKRTKKALRQQQIKDLVELASAGIWCLISGLLFTGSIYLILYMNTPV